MRFFQQLTEMSRRKHSCELCKRINSSDTYHHQDFGYDLDTGLENK